MQQPILSIGLRRRALVLSVALALNTSAAWAQSPEEAAARAIVDRILGNYTTLAPEMRFDFERNYTLEQAGEGYKTTLPVFDLIIDKTRVNFGPIVVTVTPDEGTQYTVDLKFGDAITVKEGETTLAQVTIGEQSNECTWDTELTACTEATGHFAKLALEVPNTPVKASLDSIDYSQTLTLGDNNEWESGQTLTAAGLTVSAEGNELKLGQLSGEFVMDGSDFKQVQNLAEKMQKLMAESAAKPNPNDPEATAALLQGVSDIYATFTGFDSSLTAEKLQISQGGQALGGADRLALGAHYGVEEDEDSATFGYSIEYAGLQTAMAPLPPNLMPSEARIAIDVVNLPPNMFQQFITMGLESEKLSEVEQEAYWNQKMMELVMGNQLGVEVSDTYVAAQDAKVELGLEAYANPEAALSGTGEFFLRIEGMQKVIDTLGLANDESVAPVLAMLTAFSNRTEEKGKVVDTFDLQLTTDGKLMLNNKDVTAMFMPGAGAAGADAAGTPTPEGTPAPATQEESAPAEEENTAEDSAPAATTDDSAAAPATPKNPSGKSQ